MAKKQSTEDRGESDPLDDRSPTADEPTDSDLLDAHREAFQGVEEEPLEGDSDAEELSPEQEIEKLRAELAEAKDLALRHQAELDNFRKRSARQIDQERRFAAMPMIRDLLPVWDNIGRAIDAAEQSHDTSSLLEGFKMTAGQLESALARHHCVEIEALHKSFDPNLHEAISQLPNEEHPDGTVTHVAQIGFLLHDRVVRPSQVVVSSGSPQGDQESETPGASDAAGDASDEQPA